VVALTANASAEDMVASREAGCTLHLSKPFSQHQLLSVMEKSVEHSMPMEEHFV
jgi:CheY-like chemotaxis protein